MREQHPDAEIDTLDVWKENLPEFDSTTIGAKYKGVSGEEMDDTEQHLWNRIQELVERFRVADRIVLGVPMWNWAYPNKLKQLIDRVSQRQSLVVEHTWDDEVDISIATSVEDARTVARSF